MSTTTKKEINALKDKAHKDLAHWQSQPSTAENRQEILDIQNYLQELDQCYPQFKIGYQTPKERKETNTLVIILAPFILLFQYGVIVALSGPSPNIVPHSDAQQFKDDLNRARGTY
jgi:hypothetical protein